MADRPAESPEETYVRQLVSAGRRDIYRGELSQLHSDGFIDEVEFQRRSSLLNRVAEPTIKDAVDTLRAWLPTLHKSDESEYDYGYRSAYERIADWLEHEFPATWGRQPRAAAGRPARLISDTTSPPKQGDKQMSENSARDDLVRLLDESHDTAAGWHPWNWGHGADAILAAGWRPPLAAACGCEPFSNCAKCWTPEQQREFEIQQLAYCEASVQASSDPEDGERCSNPRKPGSIFCESCENC